jgi:hypothetical protein
MASLRNQRKKECEGKVQHATYADAVAEKRRLQRIHRAMFDAYRCKFGPHYHAGHHRPAAWQQKKRRSRSQFKWSRVFD